MEIVKKRKAKNVLQFIEDKRLSFEFMELDGNEVVHIFGVNEGCKKIHYTMYPIRYCEDLKNGSTISDSGWLREAIEFLMDMEEREWK
jgi:hypothetical protein